MTEFPKFKYNSAGHSQRVRNPVEEAAMEGDWFESPEEAAIGKVAQPVSVADEPTPVVDEPTVVVDEAPVEPGPEAKPAKVKKSFFSI